jgi:hypothetical protein
LNLNVMCFAYVRLEFHIPITNKIVVAEKFSLGWEFSGEVWEWCKRLFVLDEGLVKEYAEQLSLVVCRLV